MKLIILKFGFGLFLLFLTCCSSNKNFYNKIDALTKSKIPQPFNGVILISKKEQIKYLKSNGFVNSNSKIPLSTHNQFELGTNTAQITTVLILKETEKRNIDLNESMHKYLDSLINPWRTKGDIINYPEASLEVLVNPIT